MNELPPPPSRKTGWPWTEGGSQLPEQMPDGSKLPRISIVTPSYNQGQFIEKTIRSVLLQGYPNLEYIVIDGESTDCSVEIIKKYEPWLSYWASEKDSGQSNAINKGFTKATGEIYAWLNSDDIYLPDALYSVGKAFRETDDIGALVGIGYKVDEKGKEVYRPHMLPELTFEGFLKNWGYMHIMQPSCFFSRQAFEQSGKLDESLYFCMDLDLWLKMSNQFNFKKIDKVLSNATLHKQAKTTASQEYLAVETALLLLKYGGEESARRRLIRLADALIETKQKIRLITANPLYKLVGPFYRSLKYIK
ncbi:glycosyltransferase family 2 protein [Myxosarcina sp. GI1(2024)]